MSKIISPFVAPSRRRIRDSFTLVEILVVIAIIAIMASVALPAIVGTLKKAQENATMQAARGLELGCFQFAMDNNQYYPGSSDGTSLSFFSSLTNGYVNNTDAFFVSGTPGGSKFTGTIGQALATGNVSYDATVLTTSNTTGSNGGLSSGDPDQTPVIMSTGSTITYPPPGGAAAAATATLIPANNPFQNDGIAVAYKSGSAQFCHYNPSVPFQVSSPSFAPANQYTQVKP